VRTFVATLKVIVVVVTTGVYNFTYFTNANVYTTVLADIVEYRRVHTRADIVA